MDNGRELNFAFAGDQLRAIWGGSMDEFVRWSKANPVFEYMVDCDDFEILEDTVETNEGTPTRGSLTKMVVRVRNDNRPSKKGARDYLWTLQQERRPPMSGCWLLWQVIAVDGGLAAQGFRGPCVAAAADEAARGTKRKSGE